MASNDLEVIEKIEKALRLRLRRTDKIDFKPWYKKSVFCEYTYSTLGLGDYCYTVNDQGMVTTLRLLDAGLRNANTDFGYQLKPGQCLNYIPENYRPKSMKNVFIARKE